MALWRPVPFGLLLVLVGLEASLLVLPLRAVLSHVPQSYNEGDR